MENGIDSYLHKKFKKQLSVEPKLPKPTATRENQQRINNDDVPREAIGVSPAKSEEKTRDNHVAIATRKDNNDVIISVPNQSTNDQKRLPINVKSATNDKSSISSSLSSSTTFFANTASTVTRVTSSSSSSPPSECISLVVSSNFIVDGENNKRRPPIIASTNTDNDNNVLHRTSFDTKVTNQEPISISHTTSSILDSVYPKGHHGNSHQQDHQDDDQSTALATDKNNPNAAGKHVCPYCNLVCSKPSVLQKHIRAHTNERPYPCDSCGFSFKTRSNLYKHCRSRTHANRVMGNKAQEGGDSIMEQPSSPPLSSVNEEAIRPNHENHSQSKPYKPRFHTAKLMSSVMASVIKEPDQDDRNNSEFLAYHINEIISKNNSIVNNEAVTYKKRYDGFLGDSDVSRHQNNIDEPLNLSSKNRKRCMSEIVEPVAQKSLIKELLLKNLSSDMQCPHCKMIFQTVTELELHKLRSCKGFVKPGAKYSRSSSVNVASILTQNKNAFDNIPHLQNAGFPLKSPGPFLGKTRLVEADKNKSFSFDDGLPATFGLPSQNNNERYLLSPLTLHHQEGLKERKPQVKLFGGEVKITHTSGETKSFKIDASKEEQYAQPHHQGYEYSKLSENRVVKSGLQSGGTVLTNKPSYTKSGDLGVPPPDVIRVYESNPATPTIDLTGLNAKNIFTFDDSKQIDGNLEQPYGRYTNMDDFSANAVKSLVPNLKQPNLAVPGVPAPSRLGFSVITTNSDSVFIKSSPDKFVHKVVTPVGSQATNLYNPMNLYVNGKVVRYVPGIPGPVVTEEPVDMAKKQKSGEDRQEEKKSVYLTPPPPPPEKLGVMASPKSPISRPSEVTMKKFSRPNSLALKPTTASLKQCHGLTPTMFNQILISPDTPRVAKKYVEQFIHGNYFSYLGLKCSTRNVYCTLNKTQPFYVPHYKKLSMYSEWRQQDTKTDRLYVTAYDSRQTRTRFTMAGKTVADLIVHSSYKFVVSEGTKSEKGDDAQKALSVLGGYECNEDYTYIRGRGRGRYVCDQCGIRCKKPSMLKKHIRTHSNDRPYTCNHCNFSFKTKGNLTKHMKSKAHTKNYAATGSSSSSTQQSGTQSSDSDTDDSGMDSSDESTRREEHEAAYGLLSLSQKTAHPGSHHVTSLTADDSQQATTSRRDAVAPSSGHAEPSNNNNNIYGDSDDIAYVSKARRRILDENHYDFRDYGDNSAFLDDTAKQARNLVRIMGRTGSVRPLTYPYTSPSPRESSRLSISEVSDVEIVEDKSEPTPITQFDVIQRYAPLPKHAKEGEVAKAPPPVLKVNDSVVLGNDPTRNKRKFPPSPRSDSVVKLPKTDEVMDLSMAPSGDCRTPPATSPLPGQLSREQVEDLNNAVYRAIKKKLDFYPATPHRASDVHKFGVAMATAEEADRAKNNGHVTAPATPLQEHHRNNCESPKSYKSVEYDNSAMETLADIATKQVKLEKNTLAKSVASEYLKIATKNDGDRGRGEHGGGYHHGNDVNEMIVKPEGSKSCSVCAKSFSKPSQLRLHMNIHYLERPFRCHSCSVSFRSKGHLQKHERSASHHNKLSSSPAQSSSEPRPFKCVDCNIAFRIHGHLAKHLRSKMHIMKLECLAKIPFGLYAELERSNTLLTEINTADGDQCLESLKTLAKKVFISDRNKFNKIEADS